jgi:hypothetical protein
MIEARKHISVDPVSVVHRFCRIGRIHGLLAGIIQEAVDTPMMIIMSTLRFNKTVVKGIYALEVGGGEP